MAGLTVAAARGPVGRMAPVIRIAAPHDPPVTALLHASRALMQTLFPPEENFALDLNGLAAPGVTLWLAEGPSPLGCIALKQAHGYGEVKAMFVTPEARGQGVGRALLAKAEARARAVGLPALRLETGAPLEAAIRLYRAAGFMPCGAFGGYPEGGSSLFFEKRLA